METLLRLTILGSGLTLLLAGLKGPLLRRCGGRWYCRIWLLALAAYSVPYRVALPRLPPKSSVIPSAEAAGTALAVLPEISPPVFPELLPAETFSLAEMLQAFYFAGLALFLLYNGCVYACFRHMLAQSACAVKNAETEACFSEVQKELKIRRRLLLRKSSLAASPMLTGLFRPQVILPERAFTQKELRLIFRHELTHHKRKDLLYKAAALAVRAAHWFNPLSALMLQSINEACEYSCDEAVANGLDMQGKREYSEMLLEQACTGWKSGAFFAGFRWRGQKKKVLERRIEIIMGKKRYQWAGATVILMAGLAAGANIMNFQPIYAAPEPAPVQHQAEPAEEPAAPVPSIQNEADAIRFTADAIGRLFGTETEALEVWAELEHEKNSVQPEGWWFLRFYNSKEQDYAAWLNPDTGSLRIVRGMATGSPSEEEKARLQQDEGWLEKAEALLKEQYGEAREPAETSFANPANPSQGTADVRLLMEDGTYYTISFRSSDGQLKSFAYSAESAGS